MSKRISMRDMAQALGISISTVSFILAGKSEEMKISKALTKKVLTYAEENNYRMDYRAQSLKTGKTHTIGLIIEKISDSFFSSLAYQIEKKAYENGYKIIYCSTENKVNTARELIKMLHSRHVDGFLIVPPEGIEQDVQLLINENIPVVLLDRYLNLDCSSVVLDNLNCSYQAINHFIDNGNRNVGFITINSGQNQMDDRKKGYMQALAEKGLKECVLEIPFLSEDTDVQKQISRFLDAQPNLDALLFSTNYLAFNGLKVIRQRGKSIPNDIAIVAFDDQPYFEIGSPSISAIAQPIARIGNTALSLLLSKINDKNRISESFRAVIPGELIVRESSNYVRRQAKVCA